MARLPVPGSDSGTWGDVLNQFLLQTHNGDGTLKDNSVTGNNIAPNSVSSSALLNSTVSLAKLNVPSGTDGQVLTRDSGMTGGLSWATITGSGSVPDANASTKGILQLSGDLGGTAASPTVPGLAGKEPTITAGTTGQYYRGDKTWVTLDKTAVGLSNVDNTSDATKNSASATLTNKTISGASNTLSNIPQSAVTNLVSDLAGKETTITAGTTGQYWRGDKSWQTLDKTTVGLGNVDNTSDATKNSAAVTLTNKTLTNPRINSIRDTNGNMSLDLTATASAQNYFYINNQDAGNYPGIGAAGVDTNLGIDLIPKGTGRIRIFAPSGQTPTLEGLNGDTNNDFNLVSNGTGKVKANGVEVATISGTQTLTNKTIDGGSNTFSAVPASAVSVGNTGAPTVVSTSSLSGNTTNTMNVPIPTGVTTNDVVMVFIYHNGPNSITVTPPAGFTEDTSSPQTSGGNVTTVRAFWHRATSTESGTYSFSLGSTVYCSSVVVRVSGVVTSGNPINVSTGASTNIANDPASVSMTTSAANTLLVWVASDYSGYAITPPSGFGTAVDFGAAGASNRFIAATKAQSSSGATGTQSGTGSSSTAYNTWMGALLPSTTTTLSNALTAKEDAITAGTTGQYWRGDKTWVTLDKTAVGLGNVDNTSDADKLVSTATLSNKTIDTSNVIRASDATFEIRHSGGATQKARFDTTLVTAGNTRVVSVPDFDLTLVGTSSTQTLTNKRVTQRVTSIASSATPTINTDNCDAVTITALATNITSMTTSLSGTPSNFDKLTIRIKDDGTARTIAWGASWQAGDQATLITTTVVGKTHQLGFVYDSVVGKWICVAGVTY